MGRTGIGAVGLMVSLSALWFSIGGQAESSPSVTAGAAAASTSILPKQWHATAQRAAPWDESAPSVSEPTVPYLPGKVASSIATSTAILAGKTGGSLRVEGEPTKDGIRLTIVAPARPGTYSGTATLGPDSDVDLTIDVSDAWPWPLVTLLLGILFALIVQHEVAVSRKILPLERRQAERRERFVRAVDGFDTATQGRFKEALKNLRAEWVARDEALVAVFRSLARQTLTLDTRDPDYVAAQRESDRLDGVIPILERLPAALQALNKQLGDLDIPAMSKASSAPFDLDKEGRTFQLARPAFIDASIEAYGKGLVLTLDTITGLEGRMRQVGAMADAWLGWVDDLRHWQSILQAISAVEALSRSDRALLADARRLLAKMRWDLWRASGPDDLVARGYPADRRTLEGAVAQLSRYLAEVPAAPFAAGQAMQFSLLTPALTLARVLGVLGANDDVAAAAFEVRWLAVRETAGYTLVFFAVLAALLYAGIAALYVGKPFGSPTDYLAAFFWGSSAKIGLDITASALASFRLPAQAPA